MKELPVDDTIREIWKKYPLRIYGGKDSPCHGKPTVLVQSMRGGYVTRNCPECGGRESFSDLDFHRLGLWVACPDCKQPMIAQRVPNSNYGYVCVQCQSFIKLAALLPRWMDL
jgi:hypothetical protein